MTLPKPIVARVIALREQWRLAECASILVGLTIVCVLAFASTHGTEGYRLFALFLAMTGVVPLLHWKKRPQVTQVFVGDGFVRVGEATLRAWDVTGVRVAPGSVGASVAIGLGGDTLFVEVGSKADAESIASQLRTNGSDHISVDDRTRGWRDGLQRSIAVITVLNAAFYGYTAERLPEYKISGIGPMILGGVSVVLMLWRRFGPPRETLKNGVDESSKVRSPESSPMFHAAVHLFLARLHLAPPWNTPSQLGRLERGSDEVEAWVTRLDAMTAPQGGYRDDQIPREALLDAVKHSTLDPLVRGAAARVLRVVHMEDADRLLEMVKQPDHSEGRVQQFVRAICQGNAADVEHALWALGPSFFVDRDVTLKAHLVEPSPVREP